MPTVTPLLGVMELDPYAREFRQLPFLVGSWLQDAGGFAAVGLLLWMIYALFTPSPAIAGSRRKLISKFMAIVGILALIAYIVALSLTVLKRIEVDKVVSDLPAQQQQQQEKLFHIPTKYDDAQEWSLAVAGFLALLAFCEPLVLDLAKLRWRRIYALAKLSFKEAIRRRIVWVLFFFLLIFLFPATWFFFKRVKQEDVLKTTISVISYAMTALLIFTALLLSAFSIPGDVKNQTIHTIVTKPVERFEIVVGRFLGYAALETMALLILTSVSLLFISTSNVNAAAKAESMIARVPVYGNLYFARERIVDKKLERKPMPGIDVGREHSYRKFIQGAPDSYDRAIWSFADANKLRPLQNMTAIPVEFGFDIYRTTKGVENQGVRCTFDLVTWKWDPAQDDEYQNEIRQAFGSLRNITPEDPANPSEKARSDWAKISDIAEKYGRYEYKSYALFDYHTYKLYVPPGLIKNALSGKPTQEATGANRMESTLLMVKVKCESPSQYVGVAPLDVYFLESEGSFYVNFFKGALGLWCRLTIVIGLAVATSTYFAGVVSFLLALILFLAGYFQEFIYSLATGINAGGGPFESFTRLVKGQTTAAELDKTPTVSVALFADDMFRWLLRRILNVIPETERFTWSNYLSQGFNIGNEFIIMNLLFLLAYMLPWAVLAYYLMRSRDIAA